MIVPILARPELLYQMLDSIDYPVGDLVVIDNGAGVDPERIADSDQIERSWLLPSPTNLGVATSWNFGIKATPHAPWWLIVNFDVTWPAGSLAGFDTKDASSVVRLVRHAQPWCAFSVGEEVVRQVGLFDEYLYPAYCEDNDYEVRCEAAGAPIVQSAIPVQHSTSSTLEAGYRAKNDRTFLSNLNYYRDKKERGDLSEGHWSLTRRRVNSWD